MVLWTAVIKKLKMTGGAQSPQSPFNYLYSNAGSQDNKQEKLEFLIYNYIFFLLGITWNLVERFTGLEF